MRFSPTNRWRLPVHRAGWSRNEDGATALEFAILAMPLLFFLLGIVGMGLYFLASSGLEYGVEAAARKIRTGEADKSDMTVGQFRQLVCEKAQTFAIIDCGKITVIVQHASNWTGISPQSCLDGKSNMVGSTGTDGELISKYSGKASEVVLVTLCYQWDPASSLAFLRLGKNADGTGPAVIQAGAAFKSEPYTDGAS